jgi:hypothetical protein
MRLAQSPRELSAPMPHIRCAKLDQPWLNPIMSNSHRSIPLREGLTVRCVALCLAAAGHAPWLFLLVSTCCAISTGYASYLRM